jgi:hypothetical protein
LGARDGHDAADNESDGEHGGDRRGAGVPSKELTHSIAEGISSSKHRLALEPSFKIIAQSLGGSVALSWVLRGGCPYDVLKITAKKAEQACQ